MAFSNLETSSLTIGGVALAAWLNTWTQFCRAFKEEK